MASRDCETIRLLDDPSSSSLSSRCCRCSLKATAIAVLLIAVFVKVVNPILDELIAPLEDDEQNSPPEHERLPFDPSVTDVLGYDEMGFVKEGRHGEYNIGLTYITSQSFPRWATKLLERYEPLNNAGDNDGASEKRTTDILDARRRQSELSFEESGFALLDMKDTPSLRTVTNWRSQTDVKSFQRELEPHLLELFPDNVRDTITRIEFTYNVVRGGNTFGDQPAAVNAPHLDYTQNDTARNVFHEEYPAYDFVREPQLLMGKENTDDEEMRVLLGIWKPIDTSVGVCDRPLAVMDARTFSQAQESFFPIHINFGFFTLHNLNGGIRYHENQKWYYYPFQKEHEVLIFHQYSKDRHFCNPHGSFENPNCPVDANKRVSVEMRAAVFFAKKKNKSNNKKQQQQEQQHQQQQ